MNRSMGEVDQITQRTATASEELAAAAEEMSAQAEGLRQLSDFFTLEDAASARPPRPPREAPRRDKRALNGKTHPTQAFHAMNFGASSGAEHEFQPF